MRSHLLVLIVVLCTSLICHGCRDAEDHARRVPKLAGQWVGPDESGRRQIWIGLWGDQTYELRETERRAKADDPPLRAHHGRWVITEIADDDVPTFEIDIVVEGSASRARESVDQGLYPVRLTGPNEQQQWQFETPWGRYRVGHDEGA